MPRENSKSNARKSGMYGAFVVGFLLLLIAFLIHRYVIGPEPSHNSGSEFTQHLFFDLGFVVLTVAILHAFWSLFGGDPVEAALERVENSLERSLPLIRDSKETGVERIAESSKQFSVQSDWSGMLQGARQQVDLMGISLYVWTENAHFEEDVAALVRRNVRVRVLIMDPENAHLVSLINTEICTLAHVVQATNSAIAAFKKIGNSLENALPFGSSGLFEVRQVKQGLTLCNYSRFDNDQINVTTYLYSEVASRSPHMIIRGGDTALFKAFAAEFECLWRANPGSLIKKQAVQPVVD